MSSNMIVLKGKGHYEEGVLTTTASPGMGLERSTGNSYARITASQANALKGLDGLIIALEDSLQGKTKDDAYAIGDVVSAYTPVPGDVVQVLIKDGETIADGDSIIPEGGGTGLWVEAASSSTTDFPLKAKEAVSPSGSNALCEVEVLRV